MSRSTLLALVAAICLPAAPVAAASKRACRNACAAAIASCAATCSTFGKLDRPCRQAVLKRCRREGVAVCAAAVTTTTTTLATTTTTTTPPAANLTTGIVLFTPPTPTCAQTFTVGVDVANLGTSATSAGGTVTLVDRRFATGSQEGNTLGGFTILQPGQVFRVNMPITISTWPSERHDITLVVDPSDEIPESNEADNERVVSYTLAQGACP